MKKLKRFVIQAAGARSTFYVVSRPDYRIHGWDAVTEWSERCLVDEDFVKWFFGRGPDPGYLLFEAEIKPRKVSREKYEPKSKK